MGFEMKSLKKCFCVLMSLLLSFSFVLFACGCSSQDVGTSASSEETSKTKITFVLDYTPNTNHLGLYVAKDKGFFEDEGIEVDIQSPPEDGADALVGSGKAQFGVSFQDWMATYYGSETELPVVALAAIAQHNTSCILSLASSGIKSPRDMQGKTYASMDVATELAILKNLVESDGGDFSKVNCISNSAADEVQGLESGLFDCIWSYENWGAMACEIAGLDVNQLKLSDLDERFDYYTPVVIANEDFVAENPEVTKAFMRALRRGYEYASQNPTEAADILCKADASLDSQLVTKSAQAMSDVFVDDSGKWGYIDEKRWASFWSWMNDEKLTEKSLSTTSGFTNDYL